MDLGGVPRNPGFSSSVVYFVFVRVEVGNRPELNFKGDKYFYPGNMVKRSDL